jgi:hypothetical protein
MANPAIVPCPANVWTKVATGVKVGNIWVKDRPKNGGYMMHTYRLTTDPAPANETESMPILDQGIRIDHSVLIDVYIYALHDAGSVRVDV